MDRLLHSLGPRTQTDCTDTQKLFRVSPTRVEIVGCRDSAKHMPSEIFFKRKDVTKRIIHNWIWGISTKFKILILNLGWPNFFKVISSLKG